MFEQLWKAYRNWQRRLRREAKAGSSRIGGETCEPRGSSHSPLTTAPALAVVRKAREAAIAQREAIPPTETRRYGRACMEVKALTSLQMSLERHG